jgi:hypothetical protein
MLVKMKSDFPLTPGKNKNPIPGQFDYKEKHDPCVTEYTEEISLDEWPAGTELMIAAHAVVAEAVCEPIIEAGDDFIVSDTDTTVTDGNVDEVTYPHDAVLAHKPGDPGSPYGPVWDTNLTRTFDNDAEWIWESYYVVNPILGDVVEFEREFEVPGVPAEGTVWIAADNGLAVYLNGEFAGFVQSVSIPRSR